MWGHLRSLETIRGAKQWLALYNKLKAIIKSFWRFSDTPSHGHFTFHSTSSRSEKCIPYDINWCKKALFRDRRPVNLIGTFQTGLFDVKPLEYQQQGKKLVDMRQNINSLLTFSYFLKHYFTIEKVYWIRFRQFVFVIYKDVDKLAYD